MDELKSGWRRWRFDQIALCVNERIDDPSAADVEHYVGLEHLDSGSLKIRRWGSPHDVTATKLLFEPGDIIFGRRRAYQRKLGVAEFRGIASAHSLVLRAKADVVLPEFLPYFMQSDNFMERALEISVGSLSPTINWKTLARQQFAVPPLEEQRRLARALEKAWENSEAASLLATAATALGSSFREASMQRFWESSARVPLPDLCDDLTVGIVVTPAKYYVESGGVPALRSLNVWPDRFVLDDLKHLSHEGHEQHLKSELHAGDIAIVRTGDPGRPGNAAVVPKAMHGWNCVDLVLARPASQVRSEYLAGFLNWTLTARRMQGLAPGTKQKHLSVKKLAHLEVAVPSHKEQDRFVEEWGRLRELSVAAKRRAEVAVDLRTRTTSTLLGAP